MQHEKEVEDLNEQIDIMPEQIYKAQLQVQQSETRVSQNASLKGVVEKEKQDEHYVSSAKSRSVLGNLGQNKRNEKSDASEERNENFAGLPASSKEDALQSSTKVLPEAKKSLEQNETRVSQDPYKRTDPVKVEQVPDAKLIRRRKTTLRKEVAGASSDPTEAFKWICAVDHATDPETLKHPRNFAVLDAKLAAGFGKVLHGELGRSINVLEEKAVLRQEMLGGR